MLCILMFRIAINNKGLEPLEVESCDMHDDAFNLTTQVLVAMSLYLVTFTGHLYA